MNWTRNPGRRTGLLYLLVSIPAMFALLYVPGKLLVHGDPAASVANIVAHEQLYRLGIAAELVSQALFILVALSLYKLLTEVHQRRAVLMVTLIAVSIPIAILDELNALATLLLANGTGVPATVDAAQRLALAELFLKLHGRGLEFAEIFWGLWLIPLGLLVFRCGFVPRIFGILLIGNCISYMADSLTSIVMPDCADKVSQWTAPLGFGELLFMFWLLIMGAEPKPPANPAAPST
jgi:hypothetical protein